MRSSVTHRHDSGGLPESGESPDPGSRSEGLDRPFPGQSGVRVTVQPPDQIPAVYVPELERDHMRGQLQDVERVPAEVVPGRGVEVHVAEPDRAPDPVPMMTAGRGGV